MQKLDMIVKFLFLCTIIQAIAISPARADSDKAESVELWFKALKKSMAPKFKLIEFYVQDIRSSANQSVWVVATSNITATSPTNFGQLFLADSMLTAKPEFNSSRLGQAQGLGGFSDLTVPALYLNFNIIFTSGRYKGSTITVSGRNQVMNPSSELSIVGGTGFFRLASGVAITANYGPRDALGNGVLKYSLYLMYF